jgi:hypothetical protein
MFNLEKLDKQSWILRMGPHLQKYGDPYEVAMVVIDIGDGNCELDAVDVPITFAQGREIIAACKSLGFRRAVVRRRLDGGDTTHTHARDSST